MLFKPEAWDVGLFSLLNMHWRGAFLDWLMPLVSISALLWLLGAAVLAVALWRYGRRRALMTGALLLLAMGCTDLSVNALKEAIGRVRPLNTYAGAHFHEDGKWQQRPADFVPTKPRGSSYPSAHAANSMAAALVLAACVPFTRPWILLLPLVVGYSRVYLAKHYPTDVLAGWAMGLIATGLLLTLWELLAPPAWRLPRCRLPGLWQQKLTKWRGRDRFCSLCRRFSGSLR